MRKNQYTPSTKRKSLSIFNRVQQNSRGVSFRKNRDRKPIFQNRRTYASNMYQNSIYSKTKYGLFQQQIETKRLSILQYDSCGCQNLMYPCPIIENNFLRKVSLQEMKVQYEIIKKDNHINIKNYQQKKNSLFNLLPKFYPQMFESHLNNLLKTIGIDKISDNQFLCLSWIQYHCKIQYITYFIYCDLIKYSTKTSTNINQVQLLQKMLLKYGNTLFNVKKQFSYNIKSLQSFLKKFYESLGSLIIPITHYSNFLTLIFKKGISVLIELLGFLFSKAKLQMHQIVKYCHSNQLQLLRNYTKQLAWQVFFSEIKK